MLTIVPYQSAPHFIGLNSILSPVSKRHPWRGLGELDPLQALSDALFGPALSDSRFSVTEDESGYEFSVALPGFAKDEVEVELSNDNHLTVRAVSRAQDDEGRGVSKRGGRLCSNTVTRSITLPSDITRDSVTAQLEHGVLTVAVKKALTPPPKRISVV